MHTEEGGKNVLDLNGKTCLPEQVISVKNICFLKKQISVTSFPKIHPNKVPLGSLTLFNPVSRITSRSWMDQFSNMIGDLRDFSGFVWDYLRITLEFERIKR